MHSFEIVEHALAHKKREHLVMIENVIPLLKLSYHHLKKKRKKILRLKAIFKFLKKTRKKIKKMIKRIGKPLSTLGSMQTA